MARIHSLSIFVYLIVQLLCGTSHAYQHRHLRRTLLHQGRGHDAQISSLAESDIKQRRINDVQAELDAKLVLKNSAIQMLNRGGLMQEKRWGGEGGDDDGRVRSLTIEELQQRLDDLNKLIQSLLDLLSSSFGGTSGTTALSVIPIPTSIQYYTTFTLPSSIPTALTTNTNWNVPATITLSSVDIFSSRTLAALPTSSAATGYIFDPMSSSNVAVYYGQTDQTRNVPLSTICTDDSVDLVILAFINKLSTGPAGFPTLNLGPHCWTASSAQVSAGATGLIDCVSDGFADEVQHCQNTGKKVLLSIGGAVGYSETTIGGEDDAARIANNVWNLFGGGGMDNDSLVAIRPFGDVIFDGFDIDNEDGSTLYWPTLISTLRSHFQPSNRTTNKPYYLASAPQCPRPDASVPLTSMQTAMDFIFVQFYNNPSCNLNSPGFLDSLQAWSDDLSATGPPFIDTGNGVTSPRLYVGAPSFPAAGSGWVGGELFVSLLDGARALGLKNLGGVMFWDGAYGRLSKEEDGMYGRSGVGRSYMELAKDVLGIFVSAAPAAPIKI